MAQRGHTANDVTWDALSLEIEPTLIETLALCHSGTDTRPLNLQQRGTHSDNYTVTQKHYGNDAVAI